MIKVERQINDNTETMLRRFKHKLRRDGVLREYKRRMSYQKPGERRRLKHRAAIKKKA